MIEKIKFFNPIRLFRGLWRKIFIFFAKVYKVKYEEFKNIRQRDNFFFSTNFKTGKGLKRKIFFIIEIILFPIKVGEAVREKNYERR
jgi:hypothetical protein